MKRLDMNYITEHVLKILNACSDVKEWWVRNGLSGYPVSRLKDIRGDFKDYISWLKDKFYNYTYDDKGNKLTYKNSDGFSKEYTYDSNGNILTYKDSNGFSKEYTYDDKGNRLTYKDSRGLYEEYTYNDKGNMLTYKNSNGFYETHTYSITTKEFRVDDCIIPLDWK